MDVSPRQVDEDDLITAYVHEPPAHVHEPPAHVHEAPAYVDEPPAYDHEAPAHDQEPAAYVQQPPACDCRAWAHGAKALAQRDAPPTRGLGPAGTRFTASVTLSPSAPAPFRPAAACKPRGGKLPRLAAHKTTGDVAWQVPANVLDSGVWQAQPPTP